MKITNAINKLHRAGFTVTEVSGRYTARKVGLVYYVTFIRNGGPLSEYATCLGVRRNGEQDDSQSDYFATSYCDSMKEAIEWCLSRTAQAVAPGGSINPPIVTTAADLTA